MDENALSSTNNPGNLDDTFDINELASIGNEEVPLELIEQLQNQISKNAGLQENNDTAGDGNLFEEIPPEEQTAPQTSTVSDNSNEEVQEDVAELNKNLDNNYLNKYKAKIKKAENAASTEDEQNEINAKHSQKAEESGNNTVKTTSSAKTSSTETAQEDIENLTEGKITEKPATAEQINYCDSLDTVDDNVKYSKYVIYIAPENKDFIESLTVKERKNLINRIIREQDNVVITKKKMRVAQAVILHAVIAVITLAISIPLTYTIINASLEASINNYRNSQSMFQTLYKEHGKIKNIK